MRIAVPSVDDKGLDSFIESHFGRARYYTIIEVQDDKIIKVDTAENPFSYHGPGDIPKFLKDLKVDVVIVGGIGRRAVQFFKEFSIEVVSGASGKIRNVVKSYIKGRLKNKEPECPK